MINLQDKSTSQIIAQKQQQAETAATLKELEDAKFQAEQTTIEAEKKIQEQSGELKELLQKETGIAKAMEELQVAKEAQQANLASEIERMSAELARSKEVSWS